MTRSDSHISVVHLLAPAPFGGLESVVDMLARGQAARGHPVCVAAVAPESDHPFLRRVREAGIDTAHLRIGGREYLKERRAVRDLLAERAADVLHTHGYRPDVVDASVARGAGVRTVTTVHGFTGGGFKNRLYERLQLRSFRRFDAVIAVSEKLRGEIVESGVAAERVHTVRNAWSPTDAFLCRPEARRRLGLPAEGPVVGWVGRMGAEKAPDVMVRAVAATRAAPVLSMIGDGPMRGEAETLAASLGTGERTHWHGSVPGAGRYLQAYDVVVLSSWTEGTPIILLEAMAAGVPVVTTAVGGVPDVVSDDEAWLAPAGDAVEIGRRIDEVLADLDAASGKARAAARRLATDFAVGPWVDRIDDLYTSILST